MRTTGKLQLVGQALWGLAKGSLEATGLIAGRMAQVGLPIAEGIGSATEYVAKKAYRPLKRGVKRLGSYYTDPKMLAGQAAAAAKTAKLASPFAKRTEGEVVYNVATGMKEFQESELQLSGLGKGVIAGAYLFQGTRNMGSEYVAEKMGQIDEHKRTNTPIFGESKPITPYSGGADGSLVFALHNNR